MATDTTAARILINFLFFDRVDAASLFALARPPHPPPSRFSLLLQHVYSDLSVICDSQFLSRADTFTASVVITLCIRDFGWLTEILIQTIENVY